MHCVSLAFEWAPLYSVTPAEEGALLGCYLDIDGSIYSGLALWFRGCETACMSVQEIALTPAHRKMRDELEHRQESLRHHGPCSNEIGTGVRMVHRKGE